MPVESEVEVEVGVEPRLGLPYQSKFDGVDDKHAFRRFLDPFAIATVAGLFVAAVVVAIVAAAAAVVAGRNCRSRQ